MSDLVSLLLALLFVGILVLGVAAADRERKRAERWPRC